MTDPLDIALDLMLQIVRLIARVPDRMRMEVIESPGTVVLNFHGNPGDTKRLVGDHGCMIRELATLLRLMARQGRGSAVRIGKMIPNQDLEVPWDVDHRQWDLRGGDQPIAEVVRNVIEQIFELPVTVEITKYHGTATLRAEVHGRVNREVLARVGAAIDAVCVRVGMSRGTNMIAQVFDWETKPKMP